MRSREHLRNSVHGSDSCLDERLDCFSRDGWVDSCSSRPCRGVTRFAFHPRQAWGSRPVHYQVTAAQLCLPLQPKHQTQGPLRIGQI
jgi:hypothetical protein